MTYNLNETQKSEKFRNMSSLSKLNINVNKLYNTIEIISNSFRY
jgi:hypothetical protein